MYLQNYSVKHSVSTCPSASLARLKCVNNFAGAEGFTTEEDHEMLSRIEKQLKRRFAVGSQVSEATVVADFLRQKYPERAVLKVIHTMIRRGELQHRLQRKMLYRLS